MQKLKPLTFKAESVDGEIKITCDASVDDDGLFCVVIPDFLEEHCRSYIKDPVDWKTLPGYPSVSQSTRGERKWRVTSRDLKSANHIIEKALKNYALPVTSKSRVILYTIDPHASFAIGENGELWPNPGLAQQMGAVADWPGTGVHYKKSNKDYGGHHAAEPSEGGYSLFFAARTYTKIVETRGTVSKVRYDAWDARDENVEEDYDKPSWATKLNSFCSFTMPFPERRKGLDLDWLKDAEIKEVPYSEKAAEFFYNTMLSFCQLIYQLDAFLNVDSETILKTIESGNRILGAPSVQARLQQAKPIK